MTNYIRKISYMIEIREKSSEHYWSKLYKSVNDNDEKKNEEWLNALTQTNSFMNAEHVNEAKR